MGVNLFYLVLLIASCVYAFPAAALPERFGIGIIAANAVLTFFLVSAPPIRFRGVEVGVFSVDVLVFSALSRSRFAPTDSGRYG